MLCVFSTQASTFSRQRAHPLSRSVGHLVFKLPPRHSLDLSHRYKQTAAATTTMDLVRSSETQLHHQRLQLALANAISIENLTSKQQQEFKASRSNGPTMRLISRQQMADRTVRHEETEPTQQATSSLLKLEEVCKNHDTQPAEEEQEATSKQMNKFRVIGAQLRDISNHFARRHHNNRPDSELKDISHRNSEARAKVT